MFRGGDLNIPNQFASSLYWLTADRCYFHPADPLTMSELLFAVGAVFSFARLLYIFPVLEVFGPCYLALMRVVNDIFAFFFVFLVVFAAFMIGTMNVYWYFDPNLRLELQVNSSYNPEIPAERRFGSAELTFRTVFWSLFGLGESDYMNLRNFANGSMIWVERIGYIMYGGYSIVVVCVLINMLIAMMAKSYEVIKTNSEMEWKYARTILCLEYIPETSPVVPTPFNLVPNPRYLFRALKSLKPNANAIRKASRTRKRSICEEVSDTKMPLSGINIQSTVGTLVLGMLKDTGVINHVILPFQYTMQKVTRRFILSLTIQGSSGTVDLEEIKQDISTLRYELNDVFTNPQTNHVNQNPTIVTTHSDVYTPTGAGSNAGSDSELSALATSRKQVSYPVKIKLFFMSVDFVGHPDFQDVR